MKNLKYCKFPDWLWLFLGLAVSVLYCVFADPMYDAIYYGTEGFSDVMYDYNMYFLIAIITVAVAWVVGILYYIVIDHVKMSSFLWWFIGLVIVVIVATGMSVYVPHNQLILDDHYFENDLWFVAWINIPISIIIYFIVSLSLKGLSSNCSTRPF